VSSTSDLLGLFISALISSTLFPGGSELLLLYLLHEGGSFWWCILAATTGNVTGSVITYVMGYYAMLALHHGGEQGRLPSWMTIKPQRQQQAMQYFQRYGAPSLLFAWLPIIGDPLCLVAGAMRFSPMLFVLLVFIGKAGRYTAIGWWV